MTAVDVDGARPPAADELDGGAAGGAAGYQAVLRNRLFLLVWVAQVVSQTAQNVVNYALVVEVERLTRSSTNVGWVIVSFSLPALLLGPPAGVFVDRVSKRWVLLATNVLRSLLMAGFLLAPQPLQAIYAVTFLASAISQFFMPAEGAIIPLLVRRHELLTATSLFNLTFTAAQVAGFVVLGPTLYKLFGARAAILAVVGMYALAAACVAALPERERRHGSLRQAVARALSAAAVWADMLEVGRYMRAVPGVALAMGHLGLVTALLMTLATLGPGFVARVLGLDAEDSGYVLAPAGLGMLLATGLLGQYATRADRRRLASGGLLAMGVSLAALALVRPAFEFFAAGLAHQGPGGLAPVETVGYLGLVSAITLSLGVEFALVTVPAQTLVAEATDERLRGRVFALLFMLTGSVSALPVLLIGALADNVGIVRMLLGLALAVGLVGLGSARPRGRPAAARAGASAVGR
jgi:MFS family permease